MLFCYYYEAEDAKMDKVFQKLQASLKANYKAEKQQHLLERFPMDTAVDGLCKCFPNAYADDQRLPRYRDSLTSIPIACLWPGLLTVCNIFKTEREMKTDKQHISHNQSAPPSFL